MQQQQQQSTGLRARGSFSPLSIQVPQIASHQRPNVRTVDSSSSDESTLSIQRTRVTPTSGSQQAVSRPSFPSFSSSPNISTTSLQNFSRPTAALARSEAPPRNVSPLTINPKSSLGDFHRGHRRNHSQTQGFFDPTVATGSMANLNSSGSASANNGLSASQIAAQAAMQHQSTHQRQRSQTVPALQTESQVPGSRKSSRTGPMSPPLLSLTEASAPRDNNFDGQYYHNGLLGGHTLTPAQTAANVVFPKSPATSPGLPPTDFSDHRMQPDKPIAIPKKESKVKLFSRPGKIGISKEKAPGALPSPNKMPLYNSLQRANASTNSLADSMSSAGSMYSLQNSSSATIRQVETPQPDAKDKEAKHKHHFLSRQKHKLSSKDDHHLPLSSAASNSKPVDPSAPSSLYNFNLPPSPGPSTTSFAKSMSGLDLRHGGRALREKKKEEKSDALRDNESSYTQTDWPASGSLGSAGGASYLGGSVGSSFYAPSIYGGSETQDLGKYGLNNMTPDDAWPFLKAKLLIIFEGEDLRLPVEDFNRLVSTHLTRCIQKRAPTLIVEDLRDLLQTGFASLDQTLRRTPDNQLIPHLVEMWLFTFTSVLPYMQAVFLPLDLEFSGHGPLLSREAAREFWGALPGGVPAGGMLEVRRIVLIAYRDMVILPRFETLKTIFSRLSLESLNLAIPIPGRNVSPERPSTAMSLDPSVASYGSQTTTLLNGGSGESSGNRSRAISNVSDPSTSVGIAINSERPFTPSSAHTRPSFSSLDRAQRQANVEDSSKQLTETVGRMLQCMSVLSSVGSGGGGDEDAQKKMEELSKGLKLNWLGRGRTGRNRRGLVGARVRREAQGDGIAV
ncbi:HbrB-like protein [Coleophoma crateriformis]|uniref:HbrB-like protein n=1 Tax=Coleophoma crateriformis TaxID=565419 RepID=A0A3D8RPI9_9HELO|nr:HbrB-like protein [Coleophoma crateriformis]